MCYMALDGRRIDNVIRDFMPRYPHDQQPAGLAKGKLRRPKPLEVFTEDNGSTFGYGQKTLSSSPVIYRLPKQRSNR